jgi:dCMP deaminase
MDRRASWDEYFMNIARVVASRATCDRKHVGAVLVRDRTILSTGYNGSIRGLPHCSEAGHMMEDGHCVRTVHAEANAIIQAAKNGVAIEGSTVYTTASPCWPCFKLIANSGARRIVFGEFYRDQRIFEHAQALKIELVELQVPAQPDLGSADMGPARPVTGQERG